ncbi:hypothetical protein [Sphingomonas sp. SRS2]|uniref:hypothetical protein n=1 Tax=Sphingomonas sp. SRS2 TaxID=133190 RepID=UPI00061849CA|nr:hypothetical protein [Sphingomonas sp. SRS2]KKC27083.1 hypothetical protein WP12_05220 [Sphingomonas sp. SRS2]
MHIDTLSHDHVPALIARRDIIEAAMSQYLAGAHQGHAQAEEKTAAHLLFGLMLDGLQGPGAASSIHPAVRDPAIRRHASRFGDGLAPILRDSLGERASDDFVARCADRFWVSLQAAAA